MPPKNGVQLYTNPGVIEGYVFWNASSLQSNGSSPCKTMAVSVEKSGTNVVASDQTLTGSSIGPYDYCKYSVHNVPEVNNLSVHVHVPPNTFNSPIGIGLPPGAANQGLIKLPGTACMNLAPEQPTPADLKAGWWACKDYARNVNILLTNASAARGLGTHPLIKPLLHAPSPGPVSNSAGTAAAAPSQKTTTAASLQPGTVQQTVRLAPSAPTLLPSGSQPLQTQSATVGSGMSAPSANPSSAAATLPAPKPTRQGTISPYTNATNAKVKIANGTVTGVIFWDRRRVAYNPSVPCQGLSVKLTDLSTSTQLGTTTQFSWSTNPGGQLGLCQYIFSRVPENEALMADVTLSPSFMLQVGVKGPFPLGPTETLFKVTSQSCGSQSGGPPSSTYLESGWFTCMNRADNVNFELVPRQLQVRPLPKPLGR